MILKDAAGYIAHIAPITILETCRCHNSVAKYYEPVEHPEIIIDMKIRYLRFHFSIWAAIMRMTGSYATLVKNPVSRPKFVPSR